MIDVASLKPIVHSSFNKEDSKTQGELGLLTDTFFSARSAAVLPPSRPVRAPARIVDEDNGEESQDYGVMDIEINWASVDIPEALVADNSKANLSSSHASHDKTLLTVSNVLHIQTKHSLTHFRFSRVWASNGLCTVSSNHIWYHHLHQFHFKYMRNSVICGYDVRFGAFVWRLETTR
jgi:hypothetical protein